MNIICKNLSPEARATKRGKGKEKSSHNQVGRGSSPHSCAAAPFYSSKMTHEARRQEAKDTSYDQVRAPLVYPSRRWLVIVICRRHTEQPRHQHSRPDACIRCTAASTCQSQDKGRRPASLTWAVSVFRRGRPGDWRHSGRSSSSSGSSTRQPCIREVACAGISHPKCFTVPNGQMQKISDAGGQYTSRPHAAPWRLVYLH